MNLRSAARPTGMVGASSPRAVEFSAKEGKPNGKPNSPSALLVLDRSGVLLFALGLLTAARFGFVGMLYVADLAFLALTPVMLLLRGNSFPWRRVAPLLILWGLWLLNAIATDVIRQSAFENYARGWAKIFCTFAAFIVIALVSELKIRRLTAYILGLTIAAIAAALIAPDAYQLRLPWKFGYAAPVSLIVVLLACGSSAGSQNAKLRRYGLFVLLAAVNLLLDYRSMFATVVGALCVTILVDAVRATGRPNLARSPVVIGSIILLAVGGSMAVSSSYGALASSGVLGPDAKNKYEFQTRAGLGLLLGGRSESLISTKAIKDSPIIGHGSWAEDRTYAALYIQQLRDRGVPQINELVSNLIPTHSHILGAWVEAGIFGGLFWAFCLFLTLRALVLLPDAAPKFVPLAAYLFTRLIWDIPFSPFGAAGRFSIAVQLCAILWVIQEARLSNVIASEQRSKAA